MLDEGLQYLQGDSKEKDASTCGVFLNRVCNVPANLETHSCLPATAGSNVAFLVEAGRPASASDLSLFQGFKEVAHILTCLLTLLSWIFSEISVGVLCVLAAFPRNGSEGRGRGKQLGGGTGNYECI